MRIRSGIREALTRFAKQIVGRFHVRRGSLAVEAAIFLPVFLVGILTLGSLIRFTTVAEGAFHAMADEAHRAAAEAQILPLPLGFSERLELRVIDESDGAVTEAEVRPLYYRIPGLGPSGKTYTDLIGFTLSWRMPVKVPHLFRDSIEGAESLLCRAFVGRTNEGGVLPFSEMENKEGDHTVWVFPRSGERYHGEHCRYIENEPQERLLSGWLRLKYSPCELCHANKARDGTLVYCFPKSGECYHLANCTIVERYVLEIGEEEAKRQGYTPCQICGGK